MEAKLTTFAGAQQDILNYETQQAAAAATQSADNLTQDNTQTADTNASTSDQTQVDTTQIQQDDSSSAFDISFVDDTDNTQAATQQQTQPQYNWKEEIKKVDRNELVKELDLDPFVLELNQHIKGGGSAIDYLNARSIDYTKVADDSLLKSDLRKEYPTLSPSQIDIMFKRRYDVPEDATDEDREFYTAQLQADAYKSRQSKIAEQQKFKVPDAITPTKDEAYEQWKQNRETQSQSIGALNEFYDNHEATKKLNESKRVAISLGEGVAPFNFTVDKPELITQVFTDGGKIWHKLTSTQTGEPDVQKQQLISLFTFNPQKFIQDIFKYGQSYGRKELVTEGQNAQRPQARIANIEGAATPTYKVGKFGG